MGAKTTKLTVDQREAKNWVFCADATTCNAGWGCCSSFTLTAPSTTTIAGNVSSICVNPGLAGSQVPSNVKTYGGRYYFCTLT